MSESVQRMKNEEVKNAEVQSEFLNVLKPQREKYPGLQENILSYHSLWNKIPRENYTTSLPHSVEYLALRFWTKSNSNGAILCFIKRTALR